jgi:hypothetical protein
MNGCQYQQKVFTLPASENCTQKRWDLAFMSRTEFMVAYNISEEEYYELINLTWA